MSKFVLLLNLPVGVGTVCWLMHGLIAVALALVVLVAAGAIKFVFTTSEDDSVFWGAIALFLGLYTAVAIVVAWNNENPGPSDVTALVDFASSAARDGLIFSGR